MSRKIELGIIWNDSSIIIVNYLNGIVFRESVREKDIKTVSELIKKAAPEIGVIKRVDVIVSVSPGLTFDEKEEILKLLYTAGVSDVKFIHSSICIMKGLEERGASLTLNVDAMSTDIAIVENDGVINAKTLGFGYKAIDFAIVMHIEKSFGLKINGQLAEFIRNNIGSLHRRDKASLEITGINIVSGKAQTEVVTSEDVFLAVSPLFEEISQKAKELVLEQGMDTAKNILRNKIVIAGDAGMIGLDEFFKEQFETDALQDSDSAELEITGLIKIMGRKDELEEAIKNS